MQAQKNLSQAKKEQPSLTVDVYDITGAKVDSLALEPEIFAVKVADALLAQAVRVHMARERSGTRHTKTRSEIRGSTRKIFRQKGTGNARHGSRKAPIFVGGGVAHGPKAQDFTLEMPKTMRRKALFGALTHRVKSGGLTVVRGLEGIEPKTKQMSQVMNALFSREEQSPVKQPATLLIVGNDGATILRAGRNLPFLTVSLARMLNAYDVMRYTRLIMVEDAMPILSQVFLGKKQAEGEAVEKKVKTPKKAVKK